jgi:hypothetical protein
MLNSQHRNNKKNNAPQAAMLIIFFVEPCRKTANASPSGVQARIYFYAVSFQSVNSKACGSMAASLCFIFRKSWTTPF